MHLSGISWQKHSAVAEHKRWTELFPYRPEWAELDLAHPFCRSHFLPRAISEDMGAEQATHNAERTERSVGARARAHRLPGIEATTKQVQKSVGESETAGFRKASVKSKPASWWQLTDLLFHTKQMSSSKARGERRAAVLDGQRC